MNADHPPHPRHIEGTLAIPLTTLLLIHDLHIAADEEDKRAIRTTLIDLLHESGSADEREAIEEALLEG